MRHSGFGLPRMLGVLVLVCAGCSGSIPASSSTATPVTSAGPSDGFRIVFLTGNWNTLLRNESSLDESWEALSGLDLAEVTAFSVTSDDIETYDWSAQTIALTTAGAGRLEDSLRSLDYILFQSCFVVVLDGRKLYGGIFMVRGSAIKVYFPTLGLTRGDRYVLDLKPNSFGPDDFAEYSEVDRSVIARQDVHDYFATLGKLVE